MGSRVAGSGLWVTRRARSYSFGYGLTFNWLRCAYVLYEVPKDLKLRPEYLIFVFEIDAKETQTAKNDFLNLL